MASTYVNIASQTLSTTAASVAFTSIPNTYTDLAVRCSTRADSTSASLNLYLRFNNSSAATYSYRLLHSTGTTAYSEGTSGSGFINTRNAAQTDIATANTFSNVEMYIPNYNSSTNKPAWTFGTAENNASLAFISTTAALRSNTEAITQVNILPASGNFLAGSTFFLYGIKNS